MIDTNMLGSNPSQLSSEFGLTRSKKPALNKAVVHAMLTVPSNEKNLTDSEWTKVANQFREKMGFTDSQYLIARHSDTENDHVHLVLSRIKFNGDVVSDSWDYVKAEQIARELEQQYSLSPQNSSWEVRRENRQRTLEKLLSDRISQDILDRAYAEAFEHPDNFLDLKTGRYMAAEDLKNYFKILGFTPGEEVWINARSSDGKPQVYQGRLGESGISELNLMRSAGKDETGLTMWEPGQKIDEPEKHLRQLGRAGFDLSTYPTHPIGGIGGKHAQKFDTLFYELDDLPEQGQWEIIDRFKQQGLEPTAVVHSGNKSLHTYFRLATPVDRDTWLEMQRKLTVLANGDPAIPHPARAMRLPGVDRIKDGLLKPVEIVAKSDRALAPDEVRSILDKNFPMGLSEQRWSQWKKTRDEAILTKPEEELTPRYETRPTTTIDYKMSGRIPLDVLLTRDDQELLRAGATQGGRDNLAFKLARNAIATQRQLEQMNANYDGDPRQLLEEFAQRCDPPLKPQDVERIWRSASSGNPTPSRSTESLEKAIAWWEKGTEGLGTRGQGEEIAKPVLKTENRRQKLEENQGIGVTVTPLDNLSKGVKGKVSAEISSPSQSKTAQQEQQEAIEFLQDFYSGDDRFGLLKGRPGTGKTHVANQFLEQLPQGKKVAFLAPTNQVREMLEQQGRPDVDYLTIHQFLGMKPNQGEIDLEFDQSGKSRAGDYDLVMVDESSMIDRDLWEKFKSANPKKALFLGDDKQLKPVKDQDISPVFREIPASYELTKPVRYEQEIGGFVEQLRSAIDNGELPKPSANLTAEGRGVATPSNQEWIEQLVEAAASPEFQKNPNYAKALAFRNETVDAINQAVHKGIYGVEAPAFAPGERFITKRPVSRTIQNRRQTILKNSQMGEVIAATPQQMQLGDRTVKSWTIDARHPNHPDEIIKLNIPDPEAAPLIREELERRKELASSLPKGSKERAAAFAQFRELRDRFDDIAHPYATTIHKAQGLSIDHAFVDWADLEKNPNPAERAALANVAASRAKQRLVVNTEGWREQIDYAAISQQKGRGAEGQRSRGDFGVSAVAELVEVQSNAEEKVTPNITPLNSEQLQKTTPNITPQKNMENLGQIEAYGAYGQPEMKRDLNRLSNELAESRRKLENDNLVASQAGWWNKFLTSFPMGKNLNNWLGNDRERRAERAQYEAMKKFDDEKRQAIEAQRKLMDREMKMTQRAIGLLEKRVPQLEADQAFKQQFHDVLKHHNLLVEYEQRLEEKSKEIDENLDNFRKQILDSPYAEHFKNFEPYKKFFAPKPEEKSLPTAEPEQQLPDKLPESEQLPDKLPEPEQQLPDKLPESEQLPDKLPETEQQLPDKLPESEQLPDKLPETEQQLPDKLPENEQLPDKLPEPEFTNTEDLNSKRQERKQYRYPKDHPDVLTGEKRAGSFMKKDKWEEWQQQSTNTPADTILTNEEIAAQTLTNPFKALENAGQNQQQILQQRSTERSRRSPEEANAFHPTPETVPAIESVQNGAGHENGNGKLDREQQEALMEQLGRTNLNNPFLDDLLGDKEQVASEEHDSGFDTATQRFSERPEPEQVAKLQEQLRDAASTRSIFDESDAPAALTEAKEESAFDRSFETKSFASESVFDGSALEQNIGLDLNQLEQMPEPLQAGGLSQSESALEQTHEAESVFDKEPEPQPEPVAEQEQESVFDSEHTIEISPTLTRQRSRGLER